MPTLSNQFSGRLFASLLIAVMLSGCASQLSSKRRLDENLPASTRIGVLPFVNLSGTENASEIVTDYFNNLVAAGESWQAVEFSRVYDGMRQLRIRSINTMTADQLAEFGRLVGLDYVLVGSVVEYEEFNDTYLGRLPQVSFNCRLLECASGRIAWVGTSNGRGDRGEVVFGVGAVRSAETLARSMVENAVDELSGLFSSE